MSAAVETSEIEFRVVNGVEARDLDPEHLEWPEDTVVVFALENERVLARSSILNLPMIEGTWVCEDKRGTTLAYRLVKHVEDVYRDQGKTHAFAFSWNQQPEVGEYLERIGFEKKDLSIWVKQL